MTIEQEIEKLGFNTQGLELIAQADRYEIWDDKNNNKAILIIGQGSGSNPSTFRTVDIPRPSGRLQWKIIEYVTASLIGISETIPFVLKSRTLMKMVEYFY